MAELNPKRWFLPDMPDVLGLLRAQLAVTTEGVEAFAGWASGQTKAAAEVREIEARGDEARRELLLALREAFVTPLEPEDLFMLSRGIDRILNGIGNLIVEAEVLDYHPRLRHRRHRQEAGRGGQGARSGDRRPSPPIDATAAAGPGDRGHPQPPGPLLRRHGGHDPPRNPGEAAESDGVRSTGAARGSARPSSTSPSA